MVREEIERLLENITTLAEAASLATSTALTDELVSHGASSYNLCFLVSGTEAGQVVRTLHQNLFE